MIELLLIHWDEKRTENGKDWDRTRKLTNIETEIYFDYNSLICASGNTLYTRVEPTTMTHSHTHTLTHSCTHEQTHGEVKLSGCLLCVIAFYVPTEIIVV